MSRKFFYLLVVAIAFFALTKAFSQQSKPPELPPVRSTTQNTNTTGQRQQSKNSNIGRAEDPTKAEYNLFAMSQKLSQLASEVAALRKENQTLTAKVAQLSHLQQATKQNSAALAQLDADFRNHAHLLPNIGQTAFSALPGMQDIANKSGAGYAIGQWTSIRVLLVTGNTGVSGTGPPIPITQK